MGEGAGDFLSQGGGENAGVKIRRVGEIPP